MEKSNRQLTAVMFTDMVGYTALMQENEQRARRDRDRHREILEQLIPEHRGTIVQYFGDGTLCVFDSAIEAVSCALDIQIEFRNEPVIPVRIGLHVGDIVYEKSGIYGDAVNVASRIESLSVPGSVLFSDKVSDDIKNHPRFRIASLGSFKFKNVKRPIEVFALTDPRLKVPSSKDLKGKVPAVIKSVAVLPFTNMSSDPENEYFSDGISEELINAFSRVEGLDVTARTSAFAFKGKAMDVREIGTQLNVDTVLEGSVRKMGNRVRVTVQLINTIDGYHLFSETYDRNLDDIFAVQDELAMEITRKLSGKLAGETLIKETSLVKPLTGNIEAYNIYLKGMYHWNKWTPDSIRQSIRLLEDALKLAPDFAAAYSALAGTYVVLGARGNMMPGEAYPKARAYARQALEMDPKESNSHLAIGMVKLFYEWDWDGAVMAIKRSLDLNPGSGGAHHAYAMYLQIVGNQTKAVEEMETAVRLDPLSFPFNTQLAYGYFFLERHHEALEVLDRMLSMDNQYRAAHEIKGLTYLVMGEYDRSIKSFSTYQSMTDSPLKGMTGLGCAYAKSGQLRKALKCLEKLKERQRLDKNIVLDHDLALLYCTLGRMDEALFHMEKCIDMRLGVIFFMKDNPLMKPIHSDPRYKEFLKKAGL